MQNTKKILTAVLFAVAAACCAFAFSGCCRHGHASRSKEATCTEDGYNEEYCFKCDEVLSREVLPALGHAEYVDGYCSRCGEPDPNDDTFIDGDSFGFVRLSEDGVLSWSRLKAASKYELSVTYSGDGQPTVYTIPKTKSSVNLDGLKEKVDYNDDVSFPAGKVAAKLTPYVIHKETVNGETIEQEYPVTESADEFRIIKLNGKFELVRLKYADERVTLNGFYSEVKYDENEKPYYLYELLLKDNKATQFYIKNYVKTASGYTAQFYKTAQDRSNGTNAISDMDLRFQYMQAGAGNKFYMRVAGTQDVKDYDLQIYGLQTLKLEKYSVTTELTDGLNLNVYNQIGSSQTFTEGDIITSEMLFAGTSASVARDAQYNLIEKGDSQNSGKDFVLTAPNFGDTVKFYFGSKVADDCKSYKEYSEYYDLTETYYGWQLYADETKKELVHGSGRETLPVEIAGLKVISYSFNNVNATALAVPQNLKQLNILLTNCTRLTEIYISSPQTYINAGAFAGANDSLVIHCGFASTEQTNFSQGWNRKSATNAYAGNYTVKYSDT